MEQTRRRGLELILGLLLAAALVLGVVIIYDSFSGDFSNDVLVSAQISKAGDALEQGDVVTYRDVIVGEVTDATGNLSGGAVLKLKIHRANADVIPANVTAVAVPASLFGATKIELIPGTDTSGPKLHDGSLVTADQNPTAASLQTALSNAYTLLTAVHPADLDAALSALAAALQGQGQNLGTVIADADAYLRKLAPSLPDLDATITSLATVTSEIAKNSPDLLTSLGNMLTVSRGILADKQAVASLLAVAPGALDDASLLLNQQNVDNAVTVLTNETPVLGAFAANPQALPQTINGFKAFADTFAQAIHGSSVKVNIILTGANLTALLGVAAGQQGTVFNSVSDPPLYTAADCPTYPGASGPNCGSAAQPSSVLSTGDNFGGTASSIGSPQELAAVKGAASSITGVPAAQLPDLVDLLLGPLLRGTPTVVTK